jgi:hypothetical protein
VTHDLGRPPPKTSEIASVVFRMYPKRTFVGLSLFTGQAFLYNAIFLPTRSC